MHPLAPSVADYNPNLVAIVEKLARPLRLYGDVSGTSYGSELDLLDLYLQLALAPCRITLFFGTLEPVSV
jgi:hypothetical protein